MMETYTVHKKAVMWKDRTYQMELEALFASKHNSYLYEYTRQVLQCQNLYDKYMNGNSIQGIPIINEYKTDIVFSELFWEVAGMKAFSPTAYIVCIIRKYLSMLTKDKGRQLVLRDELAAVVGRGLRSFPSFLREMDLKEKMQGAFPHATITTGPEQDVQGHADLIIQDDKKVFRVWSFQNTGRGTEHTTRRLLELRGALPPGVHVLFPINVFEDGENVEDVFGWKLYSVEYVNKLREMVYTTSPQLYEEAVWEIINNPSEYLNRIRLFCKLW